MTDVSDSTEQEARGSFGSGIFAGVSGCLVILVATVIGSIGGCRGGHAFFEWHYGDKIPEIRKSEPLLQWSWSCLGAILGAFALPLVTLLFLIFAWWIATKWTHGNRMASGENRNTDTQAPP